MESERDFGSASMNVFLGMGFSGADPKDFPGLLRMLWHLWPVFVVPIVCFYAMLAMWVVKKIRESALSESHGTGTGNPPPGAANFE
jgi:hypothetical protein